MIRETMLAFLDTETTGLIPGEDEVTEIACILTDFNLNEIDRYDAKIKTTKIPPANVAAINGWDADVWAKEATHFGYWKAWLGSAIPFGQVAVTVGANPEFDRRMIHELHYKPVGQFFPLSYHSVDVCALGTLMRTLGVWDIPNVKLTTLAKQVGHAHTAHRAMGDVEAVMAVFKHVREILKRGLDTKV